MHRSKGLGETSHAVPVSGGLRLAEFHCCGWISNDFERSPKHSYIYIYYIYIYIYIIYPVIKRGWEILQTLAFQWENRRTKR